MATSAYALKETGVSRTYLLFACSSCACIAAKALLRPWCAYAREATHVGRHLRHRLRCWLRWRDILALRHGDF